MEEKREQLISDYVPMNENTFFILFATEQPIHGYHMMKKIKELTNNRVIIGNSTLYGTIAKFKKDGIIEEIKQEGQKKIYLMTDVGKEILEAEKQRITAIYQLIKE